MSLVPRQELEGASIDARAPLLLLSCHVAKRLLSRGDLLDAVAVRPSLYLQQSWVVGPTKIQVSMAIDRWKDGGYRDAHGQGMG